MKTNLCQYKHLSCYGCCGHSWASYQAINAQLRENTRIFSILDRAEFRSRAETNLAPCGACKALIIKNDHVICGLHPMQNRGEDWRDKTCERGHFCETFRKFMSWPSSKQRRFLRFIDGKKLSHYTYSMGIDSGKFLKEFEYIENSV